jgi:hypothetical protein
MITACRQILLLLIFLPSISYAQSNVKNIKSFQKKLNKEFKDPEASPLTKEDRAVFKKLDFFPINKKCIVKAEFKRAKNSLPFKMKTTTDRLPVYEKYGEAHFELDGKTFVLNIYQNHSLRETEEYKNYLFLPFTDETNGIETYGGGRYIGLEIPESDTILIDFNKAYNPYCAYNYKYSCPIPPKENHLNTEIKAGVKNYKAK